MTERPMHSPPPRPSRLRKIFGGAAWAIWCGLFLLGGTVAGWLGRSEVIRRDLPAILRNLNRSPREAFGRDALTLLILGNDEDLAPGGKKVLSKASRSDMILVAKLDFVNRRISGVSIARDIRSRLPGDRSRKMNAYHRIAPAGQEDATMKAAVENLLDGKVAIDRVVDLDYGAFMSFIDLIQGVRVSTPIDLRYTDRAGGLYVDIPKGTHLLGGYDAMGYVRIRKGAGDDYMRQERQRELLLAVKERVASQWTNLPQIIDAGAKVLGESLSPPELASLAGFARSVPKTAVKLGALPTVPGKGTFLELDRRRYPSELARLGFGGSSAVARS